MNTLEDIDPSIRELLALFALYARWGFPDAATNWVIACPERTRDIECIVGILVAGDLPIGIPVGHAPEDREARINAAIAAWNRASQGERDALCQASLVWERDRAEAILLTLVRLGVDLPSRREGSHELRASGERRVRRGGRGRHTRRKEDIDGQV